MGTLKELRASLRKRPEPRGYPPVPEPKRVDKNGRARDLEDFATSRAAPTESEEHGVEMWISALGIREKLNDEQARYFIREAKKRMESAGATTKIIAAVIREIARRAREPESRKVGAREYAEPLCRGCSRRLSHLNTYGPGAELCTKCEDAGVKP